MANQSIGTPVFYIDYTQLAKAKGYWNDLMQYDIPNTNNIYELDLDGNAVWGDKNMNVWNFEYANPTKYMFGGNQNHMNFRLAFWNPSDESEHSMEWGKLLSTTNWIGAINHNLSTSFPFSNNTQQYIGATFWDGVGNSEITFQKTDSINGSISYGTSYGISYDGYSIVEGEFPFSIILTPGNEWTGQYSVLAFSIVLESGLDEYPESEFDLGAIAFGKKIEMPNSPDLKVTKSVEYDGITLQRSLGGADYVQINHLGCPDWLNGEPFSLSSSSHKGRVGKNGRRRWKMKFSYISNDKLFYDITESNIAGQMEYNDNGEPIGFTATNEIQQIWDLTLGGALPFIFCPDKDATNKEFCVCRLDQDTISAKQVAHNTWSISMNVYEVW